MLRKRADLHSSWSMTDKEMNPSTEGYVSTKDSNLQRFKPLKIYTSEDLKPHPPLRVRCPLGHPTSNIPKGYLGVLVSKHYSYPTIYDLKCPQNRSNCLSGNQMLDALLFSCNINASDSKSDLRLRPKGRRPILNLQMLCDQMSLTKGYAIKCR